MRHIAERRGYLSFSMLQRRDGVRQRLGIRVPLGMHYKSSAVQELSVFSDGITLGIISISRRMHSISRRDLGVDKAKGPSDSGGLAPHLEILAHIDWLGDIIS
jgi:hypothetical protein